MYSLSYYIPPAEHERVKQALFAAGAGKIGNYSECCWEVLGTGQFRGLSGSNPTIGEVAQLQQLAEYKVEMVCADSLIKAVIRVLLEAHPYEQPAYLCHRVETLNELK